jgi:hypothetical protein
MNSIKDGIVDRVAQAIATARAEGYAQAIADQSQPAQRAEGMRGGDSMSVEPAEILAERITELAETIRAADGSRIPHIDRDELLALILADREAVRAERDEATDKLYLEHKRLCDGLRFVLAERVFGEPRGEIVPGAESGEFVSWALAKVKRAVEHHDEHHAKEEAVRAEALRWVPCGEGMPHPGRYAVTYDEDGQVLIHFWSGDQWLTHEEEVPSQYPVTHWMVLPDGPPKGPSGG